MPKAKPNVKEEPKLEPKVIAAQVIDRLTTEGAGKGRLGLLPPVSTLFSTEEEMEAAATSLREAHDMKEGIDTLTRALDPIKEHIIATAVGLDVPGYRVGNLCAAVSMVQSTRFNKEMFRDSLITAGFDIETVRQLYEEAHVIANPYYKVELKKL